MYTLSVGIRASLVCMRLAIVRWAVIERPLCFVIIGDVRKLRLFELWIPQTWLLISACYGIFACFGYIVVFSHGLYFVTASWFYD